MIQSGRVPMNHTFLGPNIQEWAALATIVSVGMVVVLIVVNILYLKAANKQVEASNKQATESQRQADAARDSLQLVRREFEDKDLEQLTIVCLMLKSTQDRVLEVKGFLSSIANPGVTSAWVKIVPDDWWRVVIEAGAISADLYERTSSVGTQLKKAERMLAWFIETDATFRRHVPLQEATKLLDETAPHLDGIKNGFEARLRKMLPSK